MQKIILIIIATIVNDTMAAHDQSKLPIYRTLDTVHQNYNENNLVEEMVVEPSVYGKNDVQSLSPNPMPSWNLFVNFKPRATLALDEGVDGLVGRGF